MPYEPDYELISGVPPELIEQTRAAYRWARARRRIVFSARMTGI